MTPISPESQTDSADLNPASQAGTAKPKSATEIPRQWPRSRATSIAIERRPRNQPTRSTQSALVLIDGGTKRESDHLLIYLYAPLRCTLEAARPSARRSDQSTTQDAGTARGSTVTRGEWPKGSDPAGESKALRRRLKPNQRRKASAGSYSRMPQEPRHRKEVVQ